MHSVYMSGQGICVLVWTDIKTDTERNACVDTDCFSFQMQFLNENIV